MSSIELSAAEIADYYRRTAPHLRQTDAREWRGRCPIHDGDGPNFAVQAETGFWHCFSRCARGGDVLDLEQELFACDFKEALKRVGEAIGRDLAGHRHEWGGKAVFDYTDEDGVPLFQVIRKKCQTCGEKDHKQRRPDGIWNLDGVRRVLYNLPRVTGADTVYVPEGELKVQALGAWELIGTCNPGGADKWRPEYSETLRRKRVFILPDNDEPGKRHALLVARALLGIASVYILELPDLPRKGDIVDWQKAGHTRQEFFQLVSCLSVETRESLDDWERRWGLAPTGREAKYTASKPESMAADAYYGLAGDFVRLVEPHSEADPAALLMSFQVAAGNYLSRNAYYRADGAKHFTNEFVVIVGDTSKGRKGTSWNRILETLRVADEDYVRDCVKNGLSSGEGLIAALGDGVADKRLLVVEGEFARVLGSMKREGNTLSSIIREAWDHGNLNILTKNQPVACREGHISLIAHITADELKRLLTTTDAANGFANRFLWVWATRSKLLPFGGNLDGEALRPIADRLRQSAKFASGIGLVQFDSSAASTWTRVYPKLSDAGPGLAGAITSRNEAHAVRLATLYAVLDLSATIRPKHLLAALAVVEYSQQSVARIFGHRTGNAIADEIAGILKNAGTDGLTRNELYNHFGRNKSGAEIKRALELLQSRQLILLEREDTDGRPAERWFWADGQRDKRDLRGNPQDSPSSWLPTSLLGTRANDDGQSPTWSAA